jgi:hypothetical protein
MSETTVADVLDRALGAVDTLEAAADPIADEVVYVDDLAGAWRARLAAVRAARGAEPVPPGAAAAIEELVDEAALIDDPHRAIDWLSTLPQAALAALGEAG